MRTLIAVTAVLLAFALFVPSGYTDGLYDGTRVGYLAAVDPDGTTSPSKFLLQSVPDGYWSGTRHGRAVGRAFAATVTFLSPRAARADSGTFVGNYQNFFLQQNLMRQQELQNQQLDLQIKQERQRMEREQEFDRRHEEIMRRSRE